MKRTFFTVVLCLFMAGSAVADITVTSGVSANDLVNTIVGSGITTSNVTYTGTLYASGTFTGGLDAGINISSGILLTSGSASAVGASNTSDSAGVDNSRPGDTNLNALVPGYSTHDATVLEFDFESAGGDLYFNYVFGSEEYNEWVGSAYNDVFGFFLDGVNIALIPGTNTAVSINNLNGAHNSALYNNNDLSDGGPYYAIEYDGFTDVLTAKFIGLTASTHHIKLAIADAGDYILDSGVFIQAGTFSDVPTPVVPLPGALLLGVLGLGYAGTRLRNRT